MAATRATPTIFGQDRGRLLEESEKRVEYVKYRDQRCIAPLWAVGRTVRSGLPVERDRTAAYVQAVLAINDAYFDAREFEDSIDGRFFKFDEEAERRVRETTAEGYSAAVENLRALVAAQEAILDAADEPSAFEGRLFGATKHVLAGGWFPTLATYYHALDPGEKIAEGVERRERRIEGAGSYPGVRDLLAGPLFESLTKADLDAIKGIDWRAPDQPARFVNRIEDEYGFLIDRS